MERMSVLKTKKGEVLPPPLQEELHSGMGGKVIAVATYKDREESIGYSFRFFIEEMMRDALRIDLIPESEKQSAFSTLNPIKLLAVDGIAPSNENIRDGTYPFADNAYAVTAGTTNPHVQDLIDWMLSPQGQELIEKTGYVGVGANRN